MSIKLVVGLLLLLMVVLAGTAQAKMRDVSDEDLTAVAIQTSVDSVTASSIPTMYQMSVDKMRDVSDED